jgi:hypothetical protein
MAILIGGIAIHYLLSQISKTTYQKLRPNSSYF